MSQKWTKPYVIIPIFNFFLAACCGLTLRYAFVQEIPWLHYKNLMHAHSHVAMLGWLFMILSLYVWQGFGSSIGQRTYNFLFWLAEFAVLGMFISFFIQGYGFFSISFSALFMVCAIYYLLVTYRQLDRNGSPDVTLLKTSIVWFFLSTLGVWAMGPIIKIGGASSVYYYMAIQFFLHFQFNGWFTFAVLALFFHQLKQLAIPFSLPEFRRFYVFLSISCLLTFALAVTWADPKNLLFLGNSLGVLIQLIALVFFLRTLNKTVRRELHKKLEPFVFLFYQVAFVSFIAKIIIQSVVIIPYVAVISYTIRLYVLGFVHLILLGSITAFVLGYGFHSGSIRFRSLTAKTGWSLLLAGFVLTEILLFGQGTMLWTGLGYLKYYYILIFLFSALLPSGVLLGLFANLAHKNSTVLQQSINI